MTNSRHFLDHPEARAIFQRADDLVAESDRGAVLIATELVAQQLELLFRAAAPADMPEKRAKAILDYPGVLSGFAAKIDIGVMCGLIGLRLGNSLHYLRRLRNDAAHSAQAFSLRDRWQDYRRAFDLGDDVPEWINRIVVEVTMKGVVANILDIRMPADMGDKVPFKTPEDVMEHLRKNPDVLSGLRETMPRRELALATAMVCGMIIARRERQIERDRVPAMANKTPGERGPVSD